MVLRLKYKDKNWNVSLPTVRAFHFEQDEVKEYVEKGGDNPLVFDTNIISNCNTNCIYCSTQGGKYDVRYPQEKGYPFITDDQYKDVIKQLPKLGVRTFFICSNGEPLLNPNRFLSLARIAYDNGVRVITYTNGTTLSDSFLKKLEEVDVNLVMKLESFSPKNNNEIILNTPKKRKKSFYGYTYTRFMGQTVPNFIPRAFETYSKDTNRLGLESMIINENTHELLDIREWGFNELGCPQFLKHVYPLGYVMLRGRYIQPTEGRKVEIDQEIKKLDESKGLKYPDFITPDHFSFDSRRLMNNLTSSTGFPFRVFGHEREGVYHSSQLIKTKIGFGTGKIIRIVNEEGMIDMARYFGEISKNVGEENVWRPS